MPGKPFHARPLRFAKENLCAPVLACFSWRPWRSLWKLPAIPLFSASVSCRKADFCRKVAFSLSLGFLCALKTSGLSTTSKSPEPVLVFSAFSADLCVSAVKGTPLPLTASRDFNQFPLQMKAESVDPRCSALNGRLLPLPASRVFASFHIK